MHQQTGGHQSGWQEPEIPIPALQPAVSSNAVPGRLRWLETVTERTERILNQADHANHASAIHANQASRPRSSESLSALLHDTRNMVASINLYCDLLAEPGVLSFHFRHYAGELRLVASASNRLLEKLESLDLLAAPPIVTEPSSTQPEHPSPSQVIPISTRTTESEFHFESPSEAVADNLPRRGQGRIVPGRTPIASLASELHANRGLLSALAGAGISVGLSIEGGNQPIAMTSDDLTRVLINLTSNAAQAMPEGGHIQITLRETAESLHLTFADNGPGISESALETVFTPGYTTRTAHSRIADADHWPAQHRGLGLPIVRSLVAAAGGMVWATTHAEKGGDATEPAESGAVFRFEFPIPS